MSVITQEINRMCNEGEKVIESETFAGLNYLIKDGQIALISESNGTFSFSFDCFEELTQEIKEIKAVWEDINTRKCIVPKAGKRKRRGKKCAK